MSGTRSVLSTLTALALVFGLHAEDDLFNGIRFTDGKPHTLSEFADQTVLVVYFCGHCPSAAKYMRTQAKAVHDLIEQRKVPIHLVCVTPDMTPEELTGWTKERGLEGALVGQDTVNAHQISLNNILQGRNFRNGARIRLPDEGKDWTANVITYIDQGAVGTFRFPVAGLVDDKSKTLWWMLERDQPHAMESLMVARKNKALKDDADKIYSVVEASLTKRQDALLAAEGNMTTYEGLETLLTQAKPVVLKPAGERLKELGKDATIKTELKARAIFQQCQELLAHPNPQKQQAGREGLETLAKKFAETVYGKKAAGG